MIRVSTNAWIKLSSPKKNRKTKKDNDRASNKKFIMGEIRKRPGSVIAMGNRKKPTGYRTGGGH
jgi:hypothetical protein